MMNVGRIVRLGIAALVTLVVGLVVNYFMLPAMNIHASSFWWFVLIELIIFVGVFFIAESFSGAMFESTPIIGYISLGILAIWFVAFIVTGIAGSEMFNAYDYQKIAKVEEGFFAEDVLEAESDDLVVVDVRTAIKIGKRKLGDVENSSWYEVNEEYNLIVRNGEKYRVSPLEYGDVFKYSKAKETGIPGYVLINALNQEDSEYVKLDEPIKYSPSACFKYDLARHLHKEYPSYMFAKSFFELDDEDNPYWITGVYNATIGLRGGKVIDKVVITDAVTGKNVEYKLEDVPEWVDHVLSISYLTEQAKWHYGYAGGFINMHISKTNVFSTSYEYRGTNSDESDINTPFDGYNSVIAKDGSMWFYTGVTPANKSESNIGFLLMNPKTGDMKFYDASGAEEASAQTAVEGLVSEKKYSASFPTVVNIEGEETYFMTLKDAAGLVQRYAFSNVENYAKCVCASTIDEAIRLYKVEMGFIEDTVGKDSTSDDEIVEDNREYKNFSGIVTSIKEAQLGGYTYYYFMVEGETTIFMSSIENSNMQPIKLVEGAKVTVRYYDSKEPSIAIVTEIAFENY